MSDDFAHNAFCAYAWGMIDLPNTLRAGGAFTQVPDDPVIPVASRRLTLVSDLIGHASTLGWWLRRARIVTMCDANSWECAPIAYRGCTPDWDLVTWQGPHAYRGNLRNCCLYILDKTGIGK